MDEPDEKKYRCEHCGHSELDMTASGVCSYCRFGLLILMRWNGFRWT